MCGRGQSPFKLKSKMGDAGVGGAGLSTEEVGVTPTWAEPAHDLN